MDDPNDNHDVSDGAERHSPLPFTRGSLASKITAKLHECAATNQRSIVYWTLRLCGGNLTANELEPLTGIAYKSLTPRIGELKNRGLVRETGGLRDTPSGVAAILTCVEMPEDEARRILLETTQAPPRTKSSAMEKQIAALRSRVVALESAIEAAKALRGILVLEMIESGGCDHEVGICECSTRYAVKRFDDAIANSGVEKGASDGSGG